jgi:tetratricopeptide (TPR) repeat protein
VRLDSGSAMSATLELDAILLRARKSLKQGDLQQAVELFEQIIVQSPGSIPAHEGLAAAAFIRRDYDKAIDIYRQVLKLDPRRAQPLINIGAVQNRKGEFQQATKSLRQALTKDRKSAEAYYNLGIAHKGLNQLSMAVSAYREAIRLSPEMPEAYLNLANVYTEMGNLQQAIANYRRALELKPDFERAKRGLEHAQNIATQAKRSASPFGRLVRIEEAKVAQEESPARVLTPQERFEDRLEVHARAKELERIAMGVLNQLRDELEPALRSLAHEFMQNDGRYTFVDEFGVFQRAFAAFQQHVKKLEHSSNLLRAHERFIRS